VPAATRTRPPFAKASAWQARVPLQLGFCRRHACRNRGRAIDLNRLRSVRVNRPYLFFRLTQNDDITNQIGPMRFVPVPQFESGTCVRVNAKEFDLGKNFLDSLMVFFKTRGR
jgi:hypothetical protein